MLAPSRVHEPGRDPRKRLTLEDAATLGAHECRDIHALTVHSQDCSALQIISIDVRVENVADCCRGAR